MAPAFGVINDIETEKKKVGLELRVIQLFEIPEYKNKNEAFSYDCVLHDKIVTITYKQNIVHNSTPSLFKYVH